MDDVGEFVCVSGGWRILYKRQKSLDFKDGMVGDVTRPFLVGLLLQQA